MAKEKHLPRSVKEAKLISKDAENTLCGLMLFLVCLIGVLNNGIVGNFLTYIASYIFGVFYFVPFLIGAFFGIYLILTKKAFVVKINVVLLGLILVLIASLIGSSFSSSLSGFDNLFSSYHNVVTNIVKENTIFNIELAKIDLLGGGLLGRFLASILISTLTKIGAQIVVIIIMTVGLYLTFIKFIKALFVRISKNKEKRIARREKRLEEEKRQQEEIQSEKEEIKEDESISSSNVMLANSLNNYSTNEHINSQINKPSRSQVKIEQINKEGITREENFSPTPINQMFADDIEEEDDKSEEHQIIEKPSYQSNYVETNSYSSNISKEPIRTIVHKKQYIKPSLDLLNNNEELSKKSVNEEIAEGRKHIINRTFKDFGIGANVETYTVGPTLTRFDIKINATTSVNSISKILDDLSQRVGGVYARFVKVVPGKTTSGLEVPNEYVDIVTLKEVLMEMKDREQIPLLIPFGKDVAGKVVSAQITKFPHMLIAGTSGSGKSVFVHSIILSLIMRHSPDEVRLIIVDPKRVDFVLYDQIPHLLCPIINDALDVKGMLRKLQQEMERRYVILEQHRCSDISQYNKEMKNLGKDILPYLVLIIDEYNDIVFLVKDIEKTIITLCAKARAAGIHIIIATQRPSTDVVTGTLKANLATKVAFKVSNYTDSTTILNQGGAERLRGNGDSLIDCAILNSYESFARAQSPFVEREEILKVVDFLKENYQTTYSEEFLDLRDRTYEGPKYFEPEESDENISERYEYLKNIIFEQKKAFVSKSFIQNSCHTNFKNASILYTKLENEGIIEKLPQGLTSNRGAKVLMNFDEDKDDKGDE